ncbi:DUF7619 domain-containing protein [Kordia jejudonensis]|uniref:DUF7619 domain-containing protein n=1 Tax=Kordia jejudonensis TaxID=1348245 RepID=UPI00069A8C9D|nr:T9SS type A sorting domain-containing protein [Kordia jejudonensis]
MKQKMLFFFLFISSLTNAQIINFPDFSFKVTLAYTNCVASSYETSATTNVDINNDGEIDISEAEAVEHLVITGGGSSISDLTGIENFINLKSIRISYTLVSSIDLSSIVALEEIRFENNAQLLNFTFGSNANLRRFDCNSNQLLSTIDLSVYVGLTAVYCTNNPQLTNIILGNQTNLVELNCKSNQLQQLDISNIPNLENLICSENQLVNLNISQNINLKELDFGDNLINAIDLNANTNLTRLTCSNSSITTLDLATNINLTYLDCSNTQIASLDVSGNSLLERLTCSDTQMTAVDVSNNLNLEYLNCENLQLQQLDVSNNTQLGDLVANNTQLSSIDLSNNGRLAVLYINNNNLTSIDLSNNRLSFFDVRYNPQLTYINAKNGINQALVVYSLNDNAGLDNLQAICVDNPNYGLWTTYMNLPSSPVITEYCSFTPGGDYNTISGDITFDSDTNGCDANDANFPFVRINIDDGTDTGATYTNTDGEYRFYTQEGDFTITPSLENPSFFNVTPNTATINFPDNNNNMHTEDFCITANGIHNDVEIVIAPIFPARPGFDAQYIITYKNKGNQTLSGNLSFQYDDTVLDLVTSSQTTTSQTVGQLTWDYTNLMPFESRSIYVTLSVNASTDTPAVNIGDALNFTATVSPIVGDDLPNDNVFNFNQTVIDAFDPNNIICIEGDVVAPSEIGNFLHYVVNFENTGNLIAENIVIEIEIDPTQYDLNALYLLSSSHNVEVSITGNIVKIIFQSIFLESGGHGNILLKIPTQLSLQPQDFVEITANIFFDYNFPIETNNAETTFATLSNPEFGVDSSIEMYPNPTKDNLYITANNLIKSIELYDLQGRIIQQENFNAKQVNVDMANQARGIYFIKISTENGVSTEKIIKI